MVRLVHLYQSKFQEHFKKYQEDFDKHICELVTNNQLKLHKSCETLVKAVIRYMGDFINFPEYSDSISKNLDWFF